VSLDVTPFVCKIFIHNIATAIQKLKIHKSSKFWTVKNKI